MRYNIEYLYTFFLKGHIYNNMYTYIGNRVRYINYDWN